MTVGKSVGKVLLEGARIMSPHGTGIARYAKNLAAAARLSGHDVDLLVSSNRRISTSDRELAEVILFDGPLHRNLLHKARRELDRAIGRPFGVTPGVVSGSTKTVYRPSPDLGIFDTIHAIPDMIDIERFHFMRYGSCLKVKPQSQPDIFHATRPAPLSVSGSANVYTIHDIIPLRLPYTTPEDKPFYSRMVRELCRHADHIVTVSEFSRRDIIDYTSMDESRITNTYQPVTFPDHLLARTDDDVANLLDRHYALEFKNYFLFVGAIEPRKNVGGLIDAFVASGVDRPLVLAGGLGWMYDVTLRRIQDEAFLSYRRDGNIWRPERQVRMLPYVSEDHLVALMQGARALLYPSLYEGFGLPVVEAMLLGTPVVTSSVSSLPEIAGAAARYVDPHDVEDIANAIRDVDGDDGLRNDLSARGRCRAQEFSVKHHGDAIKKLYHDLLG